MSASVHTTSLAKTTRPESVHAVPRERLLARLDEGAARRFTWVSGPPGSGKTTLVSSWLAQRGLAYLWYEVDLGEADPATLFFHLAQSARRRLDVDPATLPVPGAASGDRLDAFARRFFRALFAGRREPFALVVDNVHDAAPGAAVDALLLGALAALPPAGCIVAVSRAEPPASMARLRASGSLEALAGAELRLTRDEITAMARVRGSPLDEAALDDLLGKTAGWPAGVVLLLEHAKLVGRIAEPPPDATPRVVFDYLAGEIFDRFEEHTRALLLSVACMPRLSGTAARTLSSEPRAEALLRNLARNDWFVTEAAAGDEREFRLHPLLREFLVERNRATRDEAEYASHLHLAARLLEGDGRIDEALALLVEANDFEAVARMLAEHAEALVARGRASSLARWIDELPRERVVSDPGLLYWSATCRRTVQPREARRLFERAWERAQVDGDRTRARLVACGAIDALLAEREDFSLLDPWIEAVESLSVGDATPPLGVARSMCLACAARAPGRARLDAWGGRLAAAIGTEPADGTRGDAGAVLAVVRALAGDPDGADRVVASVAAPAPAGEEAGARVACRAARALAALLAGAPAPREDALAESTEEDGWSDALRAMEAARCVAAPPSATGAPDAGASPATGHGLDRLLHVALAAMRADRDTDRDAAYRAHLGVLRAAVDLGSPLAEALGRAHLALAADACGDARRAAAEIRRAQAIAVEHENPLLSFECSLAHARITDARGQRAAAERALRTALALGREHGLAPGPWWPARDLSLLCGRALGLGIEPDLVRRLVRARALAPVDGVGADAWPWPVRIHTLGGFRLGGDALPPSAGEKVHGRGAELLKLLAALGGSAVRIENVTEALWPHMDGDYAYGALTAALHRLRRALEVDDAVQLADGRLTLNPRTCWLDVRALERTFAELDELLREPPGRAGAKRIHPAIERLLVRYAGPFLADDGEHAHYVACRERLRAKLVRCVARVSRRLDEVGAGERAADLIERAVDADPLCEGLHRQLMESYARIGRRAEIVEVYERLCASLAASPGRAPAPETTALFERLREGA